MKLTIGIDPGVNGAIAMYDGYDMWVVTFVDSTIGKVIAEQVQEAMTEENWQIKVYIESVHAFPGQGVASSFKFGKSFGEAIGALDALKVPYELVSPQKWQKTIMGLPKKKDGPTEHKRSLKKEADRRFPNAKPTLKTCDAMLIAEYGHKNRS